MCRTWSAADHLYLTKMRPRTKTRPPRRKRRRSLKSRRIRFFFILSDNMVQISGSDLAQLEPKLHKIFKSQLGFFEEEMLSNTLNMIYQVVTSDVLSVGSFFPKFSFRIKILHNVKVAKLIKFCILNDCLCHILTLAVDIYVKTVQKRPKNDAKTNVS